MARSLFLLVLLLVRSDAYAWYCSYTPSPEGWVTNLKCNGISNDEALRIAWCPHKPQDPICGTPEPAKPVCVATTESQTIACPVHYSGAINQSRTYQCSSETWGDWVTTSNNCSPDPPTCQGSTQERQIACQDGYTGTITQQQITTCPDPYGQPIIGAWLETQNSCVKSISNPTNVQSPISPVSPVNPMAAPAPPPPQEAPAPPPEPPPMAAEPPPVPQVSSGSVSTQSSPTASKPEAKPDVKVDAKVEVKNETKQEAPQKIEVPKGKDLVNGFGLVMSLDLINKPMQMQQQQLEIALEYTQELPNEFRGNQGFILNLITESNTADAFNHIASDRWNSLYRNNNLQSCYICN